MRLAELQSRIRPHFLFNALNTALALVRVDPARAEAVLEDLGELFRVALADAGTSVSAGRGDRPGARYLAIEQVRFGSRLQLQWDIDAARRRGARAAAGAAAAGRKRRAPRRRASPEGARVRVQRRARRGQVVVQVSNTVPDEPGRARPWHGAAQRARAAAPAARRGGAASRSGATTGMHHARIVIPL